jgi:hypothetical protein
MWSLLDMLTVLGIWISVKDQFKAQAEFLGRLPLDKPIDNANDRSFISGFFGTWQQTCSRSGFLTALHTTELVIGPADENERKITTKVNGKPSPIWPEIVRNATPRELIQRVLQLLENLEHDAGDMRAVGIRKERLDFYNLNVIGEPIRNAFPSATEDLGEAGKCYALERYRAAVFHAVRAAEWGLKALARSAGVRGQIDYKEWGKIIKPIEQKVASVDTWRIGPSKSNALAFYRGAISDVRAINNCWRTANLHVKIGATCDDHDARKAIDRTMDLLIGLARYTSESQKRPLTKRAFGTQ